jgi:hypothetical protein
LREIILNGTDRLSPLGGTLGRGGIPPTPPFRRALALKAAAIQASEAGTPLELYHYSFN